MRMPCTFAARKCPISWNAITPQSTAAPDRLVAPDARDATRSACACNPCTGGTARVRWGIAGRSLRELEAPAAGPPGPRKITSPGCRNASAHGASVAAAAAASRCVMAPQRLCRPLPPCTPCPRLPLWAVTGLPSAVRAAEVMVFATLLSCSCSLALRLASCQGRVHELSKKTKTEGNYDGVHSVHYRDRTDEGRRRLTQKRANEGRRLRHAVLSCRGRCG